MRQTIKDYVPTIAAVLVMLVVISIYLTVSYVRTENAKDDRVDELVCAIEGRC